MPSSIERTRPAARAVALGILSAAAMFAAAAEAQQQRPPTTQQRPAQPAPAPAAAPAPGAPLAPPVIAIVDFHAVIGESAAHKGVRAQLDKVTQTYDAEIQKIEKGLLEDDQELARLRPTLSAEQFAERRRNFERKYQDAQRSVQERQRKIEQAYTQARAQIEGSLLKIIEEQAKARGINIVMGRTAAVLFESRFDISKDVLARLNSTMPSVPVQIPK